jgi:cyclophilin family peptidyl-prolyl cis-trans isomerase
MLRKALSGAALIAALLSVAGCSVGPFGGNSSSAAANVAPLPSAVAVPTTPGCSGYTTFGVPNVAPLDLKKTYTATIVTDKGTVVVTLLPKIAPITVQSFVFLAQHHFYDNVKFHRVIPGFMIQGGDPTGTGACGPGYQFANEPVHQLYRRGVVAMANAGANTNGSQFFIMLASVPLPPSYTIFGQVTSGMDAVDRIARVPLGVTAGGEKSVPLQRVYMKSVTVSVR